MKKVLLLVAVGFGVISCGGNTKREKAISPEMVKEEVVEMVSSIGGFLMMENGNGEEIEVIYSCDEYDDSEKIPLKVLEDIMFSYSLKVQDEEGIYKKGYSQEYFDFSIYQKDDEIDTTTGELIKYPNVFEVYMSHYYYSLKPSLQGYNTKIELWELYLDGVGEYRLKDRY